MTSPYTRQEHNGVKVVPSFLCEPVFADVNNYKELLIDSGYYLETEDGHVKALGD